VILGEVENRGTIAKAFEVQVQDVACWHGYQMVSAVGTTKFRSRGITSRI